MGVTSLPVPAVVGTRMVGRPGAGMRSMPKYLPTGPSFLAITAVILAMSRDEPPPRPMTVSAPQALSAARASATIS